MNGSVTVIGGVNMDIGGSVAGELIMRDSNPGHVSIRPGGVGRNIAHNLRLLGLDVNLIAALGGDLYGEALLNSCRDLGICMDMTLVLPQERSSVYLYVTDGTGDMLLGLSDMDIVARLTPAYLAPLMQRINRSAAVVLDANLSEETILYLAEHCTAPMYADPVSTAKAPKLKGALHKLRAIKPNALEAQTLTGESDPEKAAQALLKSGVKRVFISLGAEGLLAVEGDQSCRTGLTLHEYKAVNANGAGDAATTALVWAGVCGLDLEASARAAALAGAIVAASPETNTPELIRLLHEL